MSFISVTPFSAYQYVGTWASRPAASAVRVGTKILITDVGAAGRSDWVSDGTYWRPANGCVNLIAMGGSKAVPIATLSGNGAAQVFTLPVQPTLPADLRIPGMRLQGGLLMSRTALAGGAVSMSYIGLDLSTVPGIGGSQSVISGSSRAADTNVAWMFGESLYVGSNTWLSGAYLSPQSSTSTANITDTVLSDSALLYFRCRISSDAIAGDTIALYRVGAALYA